MSEVFVNAVSVSVATDAAPPVKRLMVDPEIRYLRPSTSPDMPVK
jgi:hypothetical protein